MTALVAVAVPFAGRCGTLSILTARKSIVEGNWSMATIDSGCLGDKEQFMAASMLRLDLWFLFASIRYQDTIGQMYVTSISPYGTLGGFRMKQNGPGRMRTGLMQANHIDDGPSILNSALNASRALVNGPCTAAPESSTEYDLLNCSTYLHTTPEHDLSTSSTCNLPSSSTLPSGSRNNPVYPRIPPSSFGSRGSISFYHVVARVLTTKLNSIKFDGLDLVLIFLKVWLGTPRFSKELCWKKCCQTGKRRDKKGLLGWKLVIHWWFMFLVLWKEKSETHYDLIIRLTYRSTTTSRPVSANSLSFTCRVWISLWG